MQPGGSGEFNADQEQDLGVIDRNATTVRVDVSFNAASANGSPVTGYVVAYSGGGVSGSTTISGTWK